MNVLRTIEQGVMFGLALACSLAYLLTGWITGRDWLRYWWRGTLTMMRAVRDREW